MKHGDLVTTKDGGNGLWMYIVDHTGEKRLICLINLYGENPGHTKNILYTEEYIKIVANISDIVIKIRKESNGTKTS